MIYCRKRSWPSPSLRTQDRRTENYGSIKPSRNVSLIGIRLLAPGTWDRSVCLLHPPFKNPFLNKVKPKMINMAKDCSEGSSDWSLAGCLTLHQGERGPSRAPTGAAQVMQLQNEDAWCSSGGSSVVRKNEAIFGANEGNNTQIGQEEIQDHLNPQLSLFPSSRSSLLPLTTHLDLVRTKLDSQGAARAIWSLRFREPGAARSDVVGIPQYAGKASRAGLGMAGCVNCQA